MGTTGLYFGTSSWTAVGWETAFYPPKTKKTDFLPFYAGRFNSVEIDSTFYRIPTAKTVQQWRNRTPDFGVHDILQPHGQPANRLITGE